MKKIILIILSLAVSTGMCFAQELQYQHVVKVTPVFVYLDGGLLAGIDVNDRFIIVRPEQRGGGFTKIAEVVVLRTFEKMAIAEIMSISSDNAIEILDFAISEDEWKSIESGVKTERGTITEQEIGSVTHRESTDRGYRETKPSLRNRLDISTKFGTQMYFNDLDPDPGSAGLIGLYIGYKLSKHSMIGLSYATAAYEIGYRDGSTDKTNVGTILFTYRYSFRVEKATRPYLEMGIGLADPIIGYDSGVKGAFTFAWGLKRVFREKWAWSIENRGVYWSQDDTSDITEAILGIEGDNVTVASNEFSIGISRFFF